MRWILRQLLFHLGALLLTQYLIPGFSIGNSIDSVLVTSIVFAIINVFVKPVVKIFFLPLNLITLNFFSILINIGLVYGLTKLVSTVTISSWQFNGISAYGFTIPGFEFTIIYTYIIVSLIVTFVVSFLNWIAQ